MDAEEKDLEESELEKEIEKEEEEIQDEDEIFDEDILPFIPSTKKISTLNQINISEETPLNLEENLKTTTHIPEEEDDSFKYGNTKKEKEESKYENSNLNYSSATFTPFEKLNSERDKLNEIGLIQSSESRNFPEKEFEKYETAKRFDEKDFINQSEIDRREIKYKPLN
jgi:hypothetical protein